MRILAIVALLFATAPLAACGSDHTTVIAQPGSTVVAPAGAHIERDD